MAETIQREATSAFTAERERIPPDPRPPAEQNRENAAKLEELARLAPVASDQQRTKDCLQAEGFLPGRYFTEREGRVARIDHFEAGEIRYQTTLNIPRSLMESFAGAATALDIESFIKEYEAARQAPDAGTTRFLCGRVWYTFKNPLTLQKLAEVRSDIKLPNYSTREQIERQIHFRFQSLDRKIPDDWTEEENAEWNTLLLYIDIESYKKDNPPTDNRIGRLMYVDSEKVVIHWNTAGEMTYDARVVPPEIITAPEGWLIHAEIQTTQGSEMWLSKRIEPPIENDEQIVADELARNSVSPPVEFPIADWPKIEE